MTADHLAIYEAASDGAVRAHLAVEHAATVAEVAKAGRPVAWTPCDLHRRITLHLAWQPDFDDWFDLAAASRRLVAKAAGLAVVRVASLDTRGWRAGFVLGSQGRWYACRVDVATWRAACERGGRHDGTPPGRACAHPLALAGRVLADEPELAPREVPA